MRPMSATDVDDVCRLHAAAMGTSLWARLGPPFLRRIYLALLEDPDFVGFVFVEGGRARGFIAGSADAPAMMRRILRRHIVGLVGATAWGVVRRPAAAWPLLETLRYFTKSGVPGAEDVAAESMFCSFEPELRGRRVSGLINKLLFDELAARGHRYVKITTEADNRGAVRQLTSWGFEQSGEFRFYGKTMVTWILDLTTCERVSLPDAVAASSTAEGQPRSPDRTPGGRSGRDDRGDP
jgi:hypothetical protein